MEIKYKSKLLRKFVEGIQRNNRNPQKEDAKAIQLIDKIETNPERVITVGTKLYRCRIIHSDSKLCGVAPYFGFDSDGSLAPPWRLATDMRANYRYIPYLYCANHPYLSLVEVRPRIGAKVSVAEILIKKILPFWILLQKQNQKVWTTQSKIFSMIFLCFTQNQ